MIIEKLMDLIYGIFSLILSPINLPGLPDDVLDIMEQFFGYIESGAGFFQVFLPINFTPYFVICLALVAFDKLYPFIMWILRKIPFLGIE